MTECMTVSNTERVEMEKLKIKVEIIKPDYIDRYLTVPYTNQLFLYLFIIYHYSLLLLLLLFSYYI